MIGVRECIRGIVNSSVYVMLVAEDIRENLGIFSEDLVGGMNSFIPRYTLWILVCYRGLILINEP
jgi:hypothetical protein